MKQAEERLLGTQCQNISGGGGHSTPFVRVKKGPLNPVSRGGALNLRL